VAQAGQLHKRHPARQAFGQRAHHLPLLRTGQHKLARSGVVGVYHPFDAGHQLGRVLDFIQDHWRGMVFQEQLGLAAGLLQVQTGVKHHIVQRGEHLPQQGGFAHLPRTGDHHHRKGGEQLLQVLGGVARIHNREF
jgi:hypothetical protein